jgi:nitrite reductase/ring-hydroxylating ferredoxin subunit
MDVDRWNDVDRRMDMDRRTLLVTGGVVVTAAAVTACGSSEEAANGAGASSPSPDAAGDSAVTSATDPIASTADIPVGGGIIVEEPAVVITQPAEGDFKAFTAICPHQGCLVSEVVDNEIICACHGSRFSGTDGAVLEGPSQQGLTPAGVTVDGGSVVLS